MADVTWDLSIRVDQTPLFAQFLSIIDENIEMSSYDRNRGFYWETCLRIKLNDEKAFLLQINGIDPESLEKSFFQWKKDGSPIPEDLFEKLTSKEEDSIISKKENDD